MRQRFTLYFIFLLGVTFACSRADYPKAQPENENLPDNQLGDATITITQDGKQSIVVKARRIYMWETIDSTEADMVKVTFYDSDGRPGSWLTANRGLIRQQQERISMFGDVVGVNEDSTILRTESLFWDSETELITTDDYVEIERADGDILTGYGLRADRNLQNLEILSGVAGKIIKVPSTEPEKTKKE